MNPIVIVVPVLAAAYAPRLWANGLLRRHDGRADSFLPANELARRLLDRNGLALVRVESTDVGDHYDPVSKTVRINRARFARSSLTAATTAAHEVGHALQDASGYGPFRLHLVLARLARVSGEVGTALLIGVPLAAMIARGPTPPLVVGLAATGMLGTSLAAQLAALPSELNASFGRALPMLEDCCIHGAQVRDAKRILLACSMTYLASAALPFLVLWPRPGAGVPVPSRARAGLGAGLRAGPTADRTGAQAGGGGETDSRAVAQRTPADSETQGRRRGAVLFGVRPASEPVPIPKTGRAVLRSVLRPLLRPALRAWLRATGAY